MSDKPIAVGDIRFLGQSKIVVDAIYPQFHIVKIHYAGKNTQSFSVDTDALSLTYSHSSRSGILPAAP